MSDRTGLLKQPLVLVWLVFSLILMIISVFMSIFMAANIAAVIVAILLSTFSGSIFFPILVGYFYDKVKETESGEVIWRVFRDLSDGGIVRIYRDREENQYPENAVTELRQAFRNHRNGEVKLVGVSLRVFFNPTGPFYEAINAIVSLGRTNPDIRIRALLSHAESPEALNRAEIETPGMKEPLSRQDLMLTCANIDNLRNQFGTQSIEYAYYRQAPYCTAVIFPDRCFFSPNILSKIVPVRLPMIVFRSDSHGYRVLSDYFTYLWSKSEKVV